MVPPELESTSGELKAGYRAFLEADGEQALVPELWVGRCMGSDMRGLTPSR